MVKPVAGKPVSERSESHRYRGVRKRKWGKWVSEVRLPNSRERIWLGSYDTPEKAARAFDASLFCLRGAGAKFNFPDNPPDIPGGRSLSPLQIQLAASRFANEFEHSSSSSLMSTINTPLADCSSSSLSPWLSPSPPPPPPPLLPSVSDATVTGNIGAQAIDWSFLDTFSASKSGDDNGSDLSSLSLLHDGYDDFSLGFTLPPSPSPLPSPSPELLNYEENHYNCGELFSPQSFLWNF